MVRYRVEYEDGSYDLLNCPECSEDDITHDGEHTLNMICTSCRLHFEIQSPDKKVIQVTAEPDKEPPASSQGTKQKPRGNTRRPPGACGRRPSNTRDKAPPEHTWVYI